MIPCTSTHSLWRNGVAVPRGTKGNQDIMIPSLSRYIHSGICDNNNRFKCLCIELLLIVSLTIRFRWLADSGYVIVGATYMHLPENVSSQSVSLLNAFFYISLRLTANRMQASYRLQIYFTYNNTGLQSYFCVLYIYYIFYIFNTVLLGLSYGQEVGMA